MLTLRQNRSDPRRLLLVLSDFYLLVELGIVIGTYSSVFLVSPMVAAWHRKIGVNHR